MWGQHVQAQPLTASEETWAPRLQESHVPGGNVPCEVVKTDDPLQETAIPVTALFKNKVL